MNNKYIIQVIELGIDTNASAVGHHLIDPTNSEIESAIEDAYREPLDQWIYVHRTGLLGGPKVIQTIEVED